jgi:OOP family OmpA-OmpF porin
MKTIATVVIAAFAVTALIPAAAMAQALDVPNEGYLVDSSGRVVTSASSLCWRHRDPDRPAIEQACEPAVQPLPVVVAPRALPVPAPVAAVPPAAPVVMAAAPPVRVAAVPVPQKISFSGDALFAFDKSELRPEGRTMLDGLVRQLDGAAYETIVATGHTDRFGTAGYNQKLSERRAQAVKDYLVSRNVQAGRIDADGKGETHPVTKAVDCTGAKTPKVIACLQPDRRVDVEMKGTRTVTGSL